MESTTESNGQYYLGAYYFLKIQEVHFGFIKGANVSTCSTCINDSYLDSWSLSWSFKGGRTRAEIEKDLAIDLSHLEDIQKWADAKFEEQKIGWSTTFADYETLCEYKKRFFPYLQDYRILGMYFPESEREEFMHNYTDHGKETGPTGLCDNLTRGIIEIENECEEELGYDLIGMEAGGQFHSFHCYDLAKELIDVFGITLNSNGLIADDKKRTDLVEYLNKEENGLPPIPWFFVKVKAVVEKNQGLN